MFKRLKQDVQIAKSVALSHIRWSKKGQLSGLPAQILTLGLAVLIFGAIMLSLESFTDAMTANSQAFNDTNVSMVAVGAIGRTWMTPIVSVAAAAIMIGLVISAFGFLLKRQ